MARPFYPFGLSEPSVPGIGTPLRGVPLCCGGTQLLLALHVSSIGIGIGSPSPSLNITEPWLLGPPPTI